MLFMPTAQAETAAAREAKVVTLLEQATTLPNNSLVKVLTIELPPEANLPQYEGSFFAYILEGRLLYQLDWSNLKKFEQGQVFYTPPEAGHLVARNPSSKKPTRLLAVLIGQKK
jgi:quercetin dioxygenase-like cupin family protein